MSENTFIRLIVGLLLGATGMLASCPIELSPPSLVVRYGSSVSVNCSASTIIEGIGWEASDGGTGLKENISYLPWTLERLTDWTIRPKCYIEKTGGGQCLKVLPVVLYTIPDSIILHLVDAPDGQMNENEEYEIFCDVQDIAPVQNLTVTWYKGNETKIKTQHFYNPSKEPVNQTSILLFTPSRDDNGARLRCEAQLDLGPEGPRHPIISQEYPLIVHFGPDINCHHIEIHEGESLEGQCTVTGNPFPSISWLKDGQPIDPTVPLSRRHAGVYTIEADGGINISKTIPVFVMYGPELYCPDTYSIVEYATHNLICTSVGYPPPFLIWHKEGEEVHLPETLTRSDAGQYMITATNNLSNVSHSVEIDVLYPPSEIIELEDTDVEVGSSVGLKCSSTGNPQPEYFWSYYEAGNVKVENEDGVSLLYIHNATGDNVGNYTCYASNEQGKVSKTARVTVKGAKAECPIQITPERMVVQYGDPGSAMCNATSISSPKEIYWQFPHHVINSSLWSANIHQAWDPRPVCIAMFEGMGKCQKALDFTMYRIPDRVFIRSLNHTGPLVEGSEYQLQCDIINIAPVQDLTVRWYKGNESILTDFYGDLIRTPVNVSSTINIILGRIDNGAEFRCEAQLDLGPEGPLPPPTMASNPLNITVYYKPIINATKLPKRIPVFRGYPEELVCEAEGHPPPWIQWTYNSDKVVRVSGGNLTVSEAGLYTCNATNDVASSFVVVEVVLKEDYLPLIAGLVAVTVVVISVIFVFIYSIYYKNTKMRRYSLKNPKLSTQNGNVAHNGWDIQLPMTKLS